MLVNFESRSRSDAENVYPAGGVFDDRTAVQPGEEHSISREEVTRQNPTRVGAQELRPGWGPSAGGRIDSGALEECPDRASTDLRAHAGEFSGDASVAPVRVLAGETQNQPVRRR